MKIECFSETDTLSIVFAAGSFTPDGEETTDPDILLLYDLDDTPSERRQLSEIVIEHASERVNLEEMRRMVSFEEVQDAAAPASTAP